MQLRPRHFVLLAIILGLFIFNIVRHRRDRQNAITANPAPIVVLNAPRSSTPAWSAFDHAASLRDAPSSQFQPALADLHRLLPLDPSQNDGHIAAINGCLTWLDFYRQGMAQAHADPQMKQRSIQHIDSCVRYHLDTSA